MTDAPVEARERLLTAWRGEILAGSVYELIARRMEPREAEIVRRMAAAEGGHRRRLEQRMRELGVEVPDAGTVRVPLWLRLQARIAPVDRLLAAREAAEDEEVDDLYKRSTGDPDTDRLLREIRKEERSHSLAVADIRSGADRAAGARRATRPASPARPGSVSRRVRAVPGRAGAVFRAAASRRRAWTGSSGVRNGTAPGPGGSRARSTAPTTGWRRCSGSSPACRARPAGPARC